MLDELNPDAALLRAATAVRNADLAMDRPQSDDARDQIFGDEWSPAYADLCRLPARTWCGLVAKIEVILQEHENGETIHGPELRRTIRVALGLPCR